jgi:integrase
MTSAAVKISDAEIKRQSAAGVRDLRDIENRGLYLRFAKDRSRASWYLVVKGKWNLIGNFPGLNTKHVIAALPAIRLRLDDGAGSSLSKWVTTKELLDWFADRMSRDRNLSDKRKGTGASAIKCHLIPRLGDTPLTSIDKATLDSLLMWPMQESISIDYVRSVFQLLALAFRQAFKLRLITANPMKDIKFSDFSKAKVGIKPSRLRGVHLEDLLIQLIKDSLFVWNDGVLALMMLCHGTRIGETRQARWSHISLADREWFIPAENTKTGVEHHLPLTEQVRTMLIRYRDKQQHEGYDGQFLFPGRNGKGLSEGQASAVFARLGRGEWTSHDLRKVARTCWADMGVDHLVGEKLINHALSHNTKVYIQSDMMVRKRDALEMWHAHLDGKGLVLIHGLTDVRFKDSDNQLQATADVALSAFPNTTIGEV